MKFIVKVSFICEPFEATEDVMEFTFHESFLPTQLQYRQIYIYILELQRSILIAIPPS